MTSTFSGLHVGFPDFDRWKLFNRTVLNEKGVSKIRKKTKMIHK